MTSKLQPQTPPPGQYLALQVQLRAKETAEGGPLVITGVANDANTTDSYGTRIRVSQRALDAFMQNSILLFNHDVHNPIGTVRSIGYVGSQLRAEAEIHPDAKTPAGANIADLVRSGVLRAFSVRIDDVTEKPQKDYTQMDADTMDELSIVTLPSNRPSLFQMRSKGVQIHGAEEMIMEEESEQTTAINPADLRGKDLTRAAGPLSLDLLTQRLRKLISTMKADDYWSYSYLVAVYDDFCVWCEASEGDYYRQGYTVDAAGEVTLTGVEQEVLPAWTVVGGADDETGEDPAAERAAGEGYSVTRTSKLGDAEQTVTVRLKSLDEVERFSRMTDTSSRGALTAHHVDPAPAQETEIPLEDVRRAIRFAASLPDPQ